MTTSPLALPFEVLPETVGLVAAAIATDNGLDLVTALKKSAAAAGQPESHWPLATMKSESVWGQVARLGRPGCFLTCLRQLPTMDEELQFKMESRSFVDLVHFLCARASEPSVINELGSALDQFFALIVDKKFLGKQAEMARRMARDFQEVVGSKAAHAEARLMAEEERQVFEAIPGQVSQAADRRRRSL